MIIITGPYCFVCGGNNVVRKLVWGTSCWTNNGAQYGWIERDFCLDCEKDRRK